MTPSARLSAAIEVLADIEARRRPAADALKDWGLAHRFAGSGDRAGIASFVYDTLRRKSSGAWIMAADTPRAQLIGALHLARGWGLEEFDRLLTGERFAPEPLDEAERQALSTRSLADAPACVAGDYPEWLDGALEEAFGEARAAEMQVLSARAPVDLRVNTLKVGREKALAALAHLGATLAPLSPMGLRITLGEDARAPAVQAEAAFLKGWVEVQDEGSQLACLLAAPDPGMQVVDLCAGAGGKTLALAALTDNHGQVFATDDDKRRLAPIYDRLTRSGARNVQVRAPKGRQDDPVADMRGRSDVVLVDAPCTGTGTWRRNPDAKWRVRPTSLETRMAEQAVVLDRAADLVKIGGRLVYVTCSVIPAENDGAVSAFLTRREGYSVVPPAEVASHAGVPDLARCATRGDLGLQLTPLRTQTDGFYVSVLKRTA